MLVLKIIATVFLGLSVFTSLIKNLYICVEASAKDADRKTILSSAFIYTLYSWAWRAFVIVALWLA